jgi:acetone carboxylase gamma subunit
MRLSVREVQGPAGNAGPLHVVREWICPECDYFEDAEPGEG